MHRGVARNPLLQADIGRQFFAICKFNQTAYMSKDRSTAVGNKTKWIFVDLQLCDDLLVTILTHSHTMTPFVTPGKQAF